MNFPFKIIPDRFQKIVSFISVTPFDTSTAEGIANERYRRAALTTFTSIIAKTVSVLTGLISVPLTLNYLGTERYGLWMTISSVVVMLAFADFGLGNGLVNAISQAHGKNDRDAAKKAVSSVFFILTGSALVFSIVFIIVYQFVPWTRVFNVTSVQAMQESGPAMAVFFACFVLNLPLGIVQRIQIGYQEGFINNYWQIVGNVIGLILLVVAILLKAGLPWLVAAISGIPTLVTAVNWVFHLSLRRPWLLPRWSLFDWNVGKTLLGSGVIFMLLFIVNVLGTSTDNIIIAQFLGASAVATFAVVQRLFSLTLLVQFCTIPLWPAFSEAIIKSDFEWARRTFIRLQVIGGLMTLLICLLLMLFGQSIIRLWAGPQVIPPLALVTGYCLFRMVSGFGEASMPVLLCENNLRKLLVISAVSGIAVFILKIVFVQFWQTAGVAWAAAIGYGLFFTIPTFVVADRFLKPLAENKILKRTVS